LAKLSGISAAVDGAVKASAPIAAPGARQAALPLVDARALMVEIERNPVRADAVAQARRVGRPKGSRNRRSEELIRYVLARHAHPMMVLAQVYSRPVEALAAEVGCTPAEALAMQVRAASEALPYFESKKPVSLQLDARVIQLVMQAADGSLAHEDRPPWEEAEQGFSGGNGTIGGTVAGGGGE